ncbi:hypothetical protein BDW59DRAFT_165217 [Aspergillus cavernicola]|uniref:Zn(2)-C6 fungal-type domain-containing protein n=1 Tax=Aspergillus cavernicola TaxID=176166 RepID=A0ABR4HUL6_9EURO
MESRGENKARPAIARRSCDQCRVRKIGCDRGSPCSNCITAKAKCTHSPVASNAAAPKQRVLISAQYEQKIDDIARDISGIKVMLQKPAELSLPRRDCQSVVGGGGEPRWDHSTHIIDFVKAVLEDGVSRICGPEATAVLSSLKKIVHALDNPAATRHTPTMSQVAPSMPPLDAVLSVLRWAKEHEGLTRIAWVTRILPLQHFTDICRKVYFAVDEYSDVDFILANGYLSYIFSEHVLLFGLETHREYCRICRENVQDAILRLPMLLPTNMEVIAALTIGTFNAVENSNAKAAWRLISAASDLCQTLGYHRLRPRPKGDNGESTKSAEDRLFWTVYAIEKGLSLRLARSSNIRDMEITLPFDPDGPSSVRLGRVSGMIYEQLYSPAGLCQPDHERRDVATALAAAVRALINEAHAEISGCCAASDKDLDPLRVIYLQCDLVTQYSLLALILRATPTAEASVSEGSDDCVVVAREALEIHEQCLKALDGCKNASFMVTKYISCAILYCPFVPFSILFTRAVQLCDVADLARLDRFAISLHRETDTPEGLTHPYRLYQLLCQTARLYCDSAIPGSGDTTVVPRLQESWADFDSAYPGTETGLYDWCHDSHHFFGIVQ